MEKDIHLAEETSSTASFEDLKTRDGYLRLEVRPKNPGSATAEFQDENGNAFATREYQVGKLMTVYDPNTGGFTGDTLVLACFAAFCLLSSALMLRFFIGSKGFRLYTYEAMYTAGFSVFSMITGILMLYLTLRKIFYPAQFTMYSAYTIISAASYRFLSVTFPFVLIFSILLAISNIELLCHERKRLVNILGIILSIILLAGEGTVFWIYRWELSGSRAEMHFYDTVRGVYATVLVYFECMLLGVILCAVRAVRHRPSLDQDFIVILGCSFRKDGTLTPLLKGRVDRAVRFWCKQKEKTGKTARFIPSGGQGADECISESEAMKRYLVSECEIPEVYIIKEDQSKNTFQNMTFSKKIIEERMKVLNRRFPSPNICRL